MAEKKKDNKDKQPEVPAPQSFDIGSLQKSWEDFYQPQTSSDYMDMYAQMMQRAPYDYYTMQNAAYNSFSKLYPKTNDIMMTEALKWAPSLNAAQTANQSALVNNMNDLQRQNADPNAATQWGMLNKYDPNFTSVYANLGNSINQGLSSGYDLGPGLQQEVEQSIRGAQSARGNWLGPAPTAQEAMGTGQAAIDLYNQRIAQSQDYLNGQTTADQMAKYGSTSGMQNSYYPGQVIDPNAGYNMYNSNTAQGSNLYGQVGTNTSNTFSAIGNEQSNYNSALSSAQSNYNSALLGANDQNNNWMYQGYDRQADAFMYNEAVANGIYSTPSVGGSSMSGIGSMVGGVAGGVGTAVSGLAAAGVFGGTAAAAGGVAAAGGAAAAASAAASALCWLARKLLPAKWKAYRRWLFTEASPEFRRKYTFNARRIANAIP